jgi:tRNA(Leu) C34 or U34 (ribose-2'-O)-methylase TrmL
MSAEQFIVGKNMPAKGITPAIALCNPKYARNVSMIVRLASCYGIKQVWFSGDRVSLDDPSKNVDYAEKVKSRPKNRLPREERMKGYSEVELRQYDYFFDHFPDAVPVAVELRPHATRLHLFEHPENALYVFGPEDGSLNRLIATRCHQFVVVPTRHCLNLATTVATILWDRHFKRLMNGEDPDRTMDELLVNDRASLREWETSCTELTQVDRS